MTIATAAGIDAGKAFRCRLPPQRRNLPRPQLQNRHQSQLRDGSSGQARG